QARARARHLLPRLDGEYERCYYAGIICERQGSAQLARQQPHGGVIAYDWLREAMGWYEKAEALRPPHNEGPMLRWNTCARMIERHDLQPLFAEEPALMLE